MAKQYLMPYTNLHELNLDWLINAMKQLEASWEGTEMKVTATASTTSGSATVKVSGSLKDTLNFDFGLPGGNSYPTDTTPKTDSGAGFVGVEQTYARGDHIHPSDSTKLDKIIYSDETVLYAVTNDKQITLPYSGFATATEIENIESDIKSTQAVLETKQDTLVSGTSIRTINDNTLLGSGNIETCLLWPLWTNASPTSEFATQTIAVSNAFDIYAVQFRIINDTNTNSILVFLGKEMLITSSSNWGTAYITRSFIKQTNEILFYDCYVDNVINNNNLIPYKIYGVR